RQRYELDQVARGRRPFSKPPEGTTPPFDTLDIPEVLGRMARFAGLLDRVAGGLAETPPAGWPAAEGLRAMGGNLDALRESYATLRAMLTGSCDRARSSPAAREHPDARRP